MSTQQLPACGDFNERGYLNGFVRRGYTPQKCLLEITANSLDALDAVHSATLKKKVMFEISRDTIQILDNGIGMDANGTNTMFSLHRENHSSQSSRGVSGIGVKPSMSILSGKTTVIIHTRKSNGQYICVTIPWAEIHKDGRFTGMVTRRLMNETEEKAFIAIRTKYNMLDNDIAHGTTIEFKFNNTLNDTILANFTNDRDINPLDRIGIIFGRDNVMFGFKHYEAFEVHPNAKMYNYFGGSHAEYYTGIDEAIIQQWSGEKGDRFIWVDGDKEFEITKKAKGFLLLPVERKENLHGYTHIGDYTIHVGMRCDPTVFDEENPVEIKAGKNSGVYNQDHIGDNELFLAHNKLIRNNQLIGLVPTPEVTVSSARANGKCMFQTMMIQCEILYNPLSNHGNDQDRVMNIQENKNQFDGDSLPKSFTRLVRAIRMKKADEIWEHFEILLRDSKKPNKEDEKDGADEEDGDDEDGGDDKEDEDDEDSNSPLSEDNSKPLDEPNPFVQRNNVFNHPPINTTNLTPAQYTEFCAKNTEYNAMLKRLRLV